MQCYKRQLPFLLPRQSLRWIIILSIILWKKSLWRVKETSFGFVFPLLLFPTSSAAHLNFEDASCSRQSSRTIRAITTITRWELVHEFSINAFIRPCGNETEWICRANLFWITNFFSSSTPLYVSLSARVPTESSWHHHQHQHQRNQNANQGKGKLCYSRCWADEHTGLTILKASRARNWTKRNEGWMEDSSDNWWEFRQMESTTRSRKWWSCLLLSDDDDDGCYGSCLNGWCALKMFFLFTLHNISFECRAKKEQLKAQEENEQTSLMPFLRSICLCIYFA